MKKKLFIELTVSNSQWKEYTESDFVLELDSELIDQIEPIYKANFEASNEDEEEFGKKFFNQLQASHPILAKKFEDAVWETLNYQLHYDSVTYDFPKYMDVDDSLIEKGIEYLEFKPSNILTFNFVDFPRYC